MNANLRNGLSFIFQFALFVLSGVAIIAFCKEENLFILGKRGICILLAAWVITAWLTHKYKPQYYQKKWIYVIAPFFKAMAIQLFLVLAFSFLFSEVGFQNGILFKISLVYLIGEFFIYSIIIIFNSNSKSSISEIKKYIQSDLDFNKEELFNVVLSANLFKDALFTEEIIKDLLNQKLSNGKEVKPHLMILDSNNFESKLTFEICVLNTAINDIGNIREGLNKAYHSIVPGGYLFVIYKSLVDFEEEFFGKSKGLSKFFKKIWYYIYYRALPKIPYFNFIYTILSGGKNKVISKAETWGRLFYAGFEVENEIRKNGFCYILARKTKTPSENPNPSFYPVVTLDRVSMYGEIIKIHKIRSMYPYSEFLQKKVFEQGNLTSTGKFGNDFRITELGKIYRKYWIDELPQLLDWMRGKIKLVGIRAMSQHFFSLYPKDYQELYFKVKPGIISPIFDEKTDGFNDIVRIEQEYLVNFLKNPIKTDFKYFFITLNHMFGGVRSK